jgi:hypothetical protein
MRKIWPILGILGAGSAASAATFRVPSEYATINQGIEAASAADTVLVAAGTYPDFDTRIVFGGPVSACVFPKSGIVLRSELGSSATTIDRMGIDTPEPAVTIQVNGLLGGETVIEGFRITGNPFGNSAVNAREFATTGELTFRDCVFEDLDGGASTGGIRAVRASLRLETAPSAAARGESGGSTSMKAI